MCGRFVAATPPSVVAAHFDAAPISDLGIAPSYNVAPTDSVLAVAVARDGRRRLGPLRWGLVPSWTRPTSRPGAPPGGGGMINARAETLTTKPAFRNAFARRRGIVPADGFYEWERRPDGTKQPWYIRRVDGAPLAIAAIWESWQSPDPDAERLRSCALITTAANDMMSGIHDRMPVILESGVWDTWLARDDDGPDALLTLLQPAAESVLVRYRVSSAVNRVANNDPGLIAPAGADPGPEGDGRAVPLTLL